MTYQAGFIGIGNMGGALASAVSKSISPRDVVLYDRDLDRVRQLATDLGTQGAGALSVPAEQCEFLFLGVKPHMMAGLFAELRPTLAARATPPVLISMAAGLTLAQLQDMAGFTCPILRIMPNTPVSVGAGVILYSKNQGVTATQLEAFTRLLSAAGSLYPLEESLMDAGSAVSGCGPAFSYLFMDALADGGVCCGLSRQDALHFAAQTVLGAATMVLQSGKHPEMLKNEVCSPGGSTIRGVLALEQHGLRAACMDAVIAAFEKTRDLGKQ